MWVNIQLKLEPEKSDPFLFGFLFASLWLHSVYSFVNQSFSRQGKTATETRIHVTDWLEGKSYSKLEALFQTWNQVPL